MHAADARRNVVALGAAAEPAASVFASATGRELAPTCARVEDIDATVAVVVTTTDQVTPELLDALFPGGTDLDSVPGLVHATAAGLEAQVRVVADAVLLDLDDAPVLELFPTSAIEQFRMGSRRVLGGSAGRDVVRAALTTPSAFTSIMAHSNGFDLGLTRDLALCDATSTRGRDPAGSPCCQATGECFRRRLPLSEAAGSPGILAADGVRARILLLCTCIGIVTAEPSREWGYSQAILGNGHTAALLTSWSILVPSTAELQDLLADLYRGTPVGVAVASFNRRNGNVRLAVLGDPDVRLAPLPPDALAGPRFGDPEADVHGDGGRLLDLITDVAATEAAGEVQELAAAASARVREYVRAAGRGLAAVTDPELAATMRSSVLAFVARNGILVNHFWTPFTRARQRVDVAPCDACGAPAERFGFEFRPAGILTRELVICPRCGIRRDSSPGVLHRVVGQGRIAVLEGPLPTTDWSAVAHLNCQDTELHAAFEWPADATGSPVRRLALPAPWPPGPLHLAVSMVVGSELSIVTTPVRGDDRVPAGAT